MNGNKNIWLIAGILLLMATAFRAPSPAEQRRWKVAVLLPFKAEGNRGAIGEAMIDYYEGINLALGELDKKGLKIDIHVFDTKKDSLYTISLFEKEEMKDMDLILGPAYPSELRTAEEFCRKHNKILISPLKYYRPKDTTGLRLVNFFGTDTCRFTGLAETLVSRYPDHRYYLLTENSKESRTNAAAFKRGLISSGKSLTGTIEISGTALKGSLSKTDSSLLIATVKNKNQNTWGYKILRTNTKTTLIGFDDWIEKTGGKISALNDVPANYVFGSFVDYYDTFVKSFRISFREVMKGEPTRYTMLGYEHMMFIGDGLLAFGDDFFGHAKNRRFNGLTSTIYLRENMWGLENYGVNIVEYRNFQLRRIRR